MIFLKNYWPMILISSWFAYKWWNSRRIISMLPQLKQRGAILIDVRSPAEFASGNAPGTINIPLNDLNARFKEVPSSSPIVLCCASGTRSGMAKMIFKKNGYKEVYNIGPWTKFLN